MLFQMCGMCKGWETLSLRQFLFGIWATQVNKSLFTSAQNLVRLAGNSARVMSQARARVRGSGTERFKVCLFPAAACVGQLLRLIALCHSQLTRSSRTCETDPSHLPNKDISATHYCTRIRLLADTADTEISDRLRKTSKQLRAGDILL